jgi:arginine:pyruvate transaminase
VAARHDLWVVSDEVYDSQVWVGAHRSVRALPGMAERTLVVGSMSKSHAMTGSRLGWIVGPEEAIGWLWDLATVSNYGIPGFIQEAGAFALGLGEGFEARIAEPFRRRREITQRLLAGQNVVKGAPQGGGMFTMLDARATGLSGVEFATRLLEEERIGVLPGESFGAAAAGHVRVAMTVADEAYGRRWRGCWIRGAAGSGAGRCGVGSEAEGAAQGQGVEPGVEALFGHVLEVVAQRLDAHGEAVGDGVGGAQAEEAPSTVSSTSRNSADWAARATPAVT